MLLLQQRLFDRKIMKLEDDYYDKKINGHCLLPVFMILCLHHSWDYFLGSALRI